MAEPLVVQEARTFRELLLVQEETLEREMLARWQQVEAALLGEAEALAREMAALPPGQRTRGALAREARYLSLLDQLLGEMERFGADGAALIQARQPLYAHLGIQDATSLLTTAARETGVTVGLTRLPVEATEQIVALARAGKPLASLLEAAYPLAADGVTRELVNGVALGRNPRETAQRMMSRGASQGLNHALLVARDQQLRAYRIATQETYRANDDILRGYQRLATRSTRTCLACLALDGTVYDTADVMPLHPMDRCTMIPLLADAPPPAVENARDWFVRQDAGVQRAMMGPGRFEAWREGKFGLEQLATTHDNPTWGPRAQVTPLAALLRGEGGIGH